MNFAQWLGDASSLWLSLGALLVIALLVVLMFNAFQGRSRAASMQSRSESERPAGQMRTESSAPAERHRDAVESRIEPKFTDSSNLSGHADPELDRPGSARVSGSIDERFPPEIQIEDELAASSTIDSTPPADRDRPATDAAQTVAATRIAIKGVTAQRRAHEGGNLPTAADWGVLDDRIDCVALLRMSPPVDCIALRSGAQALARIGSKSVIAEVQLLDGGWCDVRAAEGLASSLRLGILLANRQGPLSASEFAEFAEKLRRLAGKLNVPDLRLPETMGVLERARQVDEFCARLDTLIGVNVLASSRISLARVTEVAELLQMVPRGHQRYARTSQSGDVLFTLVQAERPEVLTFVLDVPRAPAAEQPWTRMVESARRCAELLDAQVVDDALAPLSDAAAQAVARQLQSHYAQLAGAGLDAGSPAALRVFN